MKRILSILAALAATITLGAQNIAVVSPDNSTTICQTLDEAITKADPGSTIYLPGGGFQVSNNALIDKKLTIMGVSHRGDADNVDGATVISGHLNFVGGSSGSAVIGVFVTGNINVGTEGDNPAAVENFTLKYCNVNGVCVHCGGCLGMLVNQCYLRQGLDGGHNNIKITNCISSAIRFLNGGTIDHSIIVSCQVPSGGWGYALYDIHSSNITNNFFTDSSTKEIGLNYISNNCIGTGAWGDNPVIAPEGAKLWGDVFGEGNHRGVTIASDYHVKASWAKGAASDGTDIGIYGGSGFSEAKSLAPIPRIVSKTVEEQSDATGRLQVTVTVKSK